MPSDEHDGTVEQGTPRIENVICDCTDGGQIMDTKRLGGLECPECGQEAETILRYGDALDR